MAAEQEYKKTRKRSGKIGSEKLEPSEPKGIKKQVTTENPVVTWLRKDWTIIVGLIIIFFISLFLRSYFYYPVATEDGFLLSGNDPFYHKRVIDYGQQYFTHIRLDPLLNYPVSAVNPRPPAYDWSNTISGMFLSPFLNGDVSTTTWYIFLFSPAFWGALTIFPVYFLTKDMFGRKSALVAAFFMGIMSSHIERSPLGFSDHDAMVVFFVVTSIFFLAKSIGHLKEKFWVKSWRNPMEISIGVREFFKENPVSIAFAILCGISMGTVALIWKGFPYVSVILMGSFMILTFINHLRKIDSMGLFICIYISFAVGLLISFPYYAQFTTGTWIQPLYMMLAITVIGIFFVPTRDLPWIIVFPTFIIIAAFGTIILSYIQPAAVDALFTGGGYFVKSKLYGTIAEAQAPDTSRLAISYGPVTFYLALIGLVLAAIQVPKHWKMDYFVMIVWCALAIYMAMSAVRFMFNATPVFAILGGWITWNIVERLDPTFRAFKKIETKFVYLYISILTIVVIALSYWWLYLEQDNYIFYQSVFAFGLLGIFIAIFTAWIMLKYNFYVGILIYVSYIVIWFWYTFDVLIDQTFKGNDIIWDKFPWDQFLFSIMILALVFIPMIIFVIYRHSISGSKLDMNHIAIALFMVFLVFTPNVMFAIDASIPYEEKGELDPAGKTFGAFGHSFPSEYWQSGLEWLSENDNELIIEERPAFISWWDYGFWCIYLGEHPTVADNFQAGYQLAGSFIASTNETQAISLFAVRIIEGDFATKPKSKFSPEVKEILIKYFDNGNQDDHPNYDKIVEWYKIDSPDTSEEKQKALIKEVESHPGKYSHLTDIKITNAKYAVMRHLIESMGNERVVEFLSELEQATEKCIRYFAVDTRLFPFSARNTGIFYAPIRLADRDINDFIKYYADVEVRDNREADWRSYSDQPIPTEDLPDEIDLNDLVDTHGGSNVRIKDYSIKYTDDFYNSMFYKCYIGYTYKDIYGRDPDQLQEVPGIYGELANQQPMQGWNMTHFRMVYRTAYWTPYNQTELEKIPDQDRKWEAVSELEAIKRIRTLESDGKDNDNNGQVDDRGEGGTWSPSYRGGGVFFLKYYHGAFIRGKVVTDSENKTPLKHVRVTVLDEFGIPHDSVFTDEEGNYNLTAPFGPTIISVSKDGYDQGSEDEIQQRQRLTEKTPLNSTLHQISDKQAMRLTSNYIIDSDIKVPVGSVKGKLYWELNNNDEFNEDEDEIITNAQILLNSTTKQYDLNYLIDEIDEEGNFVVNEVVPGEYVLLANISNHLVDYPGTIVISSEELDVEQDLGIKPSEIWGNATFINDTAYMPGNIQIKLKDFTNNTIMTSVIKPDNKTYSFLRLLPGDYLLYVNETNIQYFENNLTLDQGENRTEEIDLIPLISVSGTVYYSETQNDPAYSEVIPSAHVNFYNNEDSSFSTVLVADKFGKFSGTVSKGNYSVYIHYIKNGEDLVHVSSLSILENEPIHLDLYLEGGFWLNGRMTKQVNTSVEDAKIEFIFKDDQNKVTNLLVPTNSKGKYRIFLPYREYRIEVYHISTPGNITYSYYNSSSFFEKNVNELIKASEVYTQNNQSQTRTKADSHSREITHDIHLSEPSWFWGYVYWDRNLDGMFILSNESVEDIMETPELNTRQNGDTDYEAGEIHINETFLRDVLTGPDQELVIGTKLKFTHDNGTLTTTTDGNGYFSIYLPPGYNLIELDDPRFLPLNKTNPLNKTYIEMPLGKSYQTEGLARNFTVIPTKTKISGYTWVDKNGDFQFDSNETVQNIPFTITPVMTSNLNETEFILESDENGFYEIELLPGHYTTQIDHKIEPNIHYMNVDALLVPFNSSGEPYNANIYINKFIFTNLSITSEDIILNQSNIANVSIRFFDEDGAPIIPLPLELNGSYYQGYTIPMKVTIWAEYFIPDESSTVEVSEEEGLQKGYTYVYFGTTELTEKNSELEIQLRNSTQLQLTTYVDDDSSGNYTVGDELPEKLNVTISEQTGGIFQLILENGTFNQLLMPGTNYTISINDTRSQSAIHGMRMVRYIGEAKITIPPGETERELYLPLIKFYNMSGRIYYDENENNRPDSIELDANVTIHFTGPLDFTLITNETGRFHKFVYAGEYFITIESEGFLNKPEPYSINVSLENTSFDIEEIPVKVNVFGLTFFDVNEDGEYDPTAVLRFGERELKETILRGVRIEFNRKIIAEDQAPGSPTSEYPEENKVVLFSDSTTGKFDIRLLPGEYDVYAYTKSRPLYASVDLRLIEHTPELRYNISMHEAERVESNVFYRDTNLIEIHDLYSEETGNAILFESMDYAGSIRAQYRNGIVDIVYLPHGNYTVSTDYVSEEFEMEMDYSLQETIWVKPESNSFSFEMNKKNDYSFKLTVDGDEEIQLQPGKYYKKAFNLVLENEGNTYNIVDLKAIEVPTGWIVRFSNFTLPLDITGEHKIERVTVDLTIPVDTYAKNEIQIQGIPRGDEGQQQTITLTVNTPPIYGFELGYESDLDRGIKVNETLLMNLSVKNVGNADDELNIKFYNVPQAWNVSIGEAWQENADVKYKQDIDAFIHSIKQEDIYKNLTIQVQSPTLENVTGNEAITILVRVWSENRRDIEFSESIKVSIRRPDIIVKNIKALNTDLKEGTNITIRAAVENKHCYARPVNFSLYINNVLIENKTVGELSEDTESTIEFSWDPFDDVNFTFDEGTYIRFKIEVNGDKTIEETDYDNNFKSIRKFIGKRPVEEEFNWRPIYAMLTLLIIFFVIYGIYRWRRKI